MEGKSSDWLRGPSGPTVCRCCFAEGCYKDISTEYFWMGKREVYAEMLSETLDLTIAYAQSSGPNSNSRLICEPCIARLRDASEFKRQVQECEKMFLQYLDPGREGVTDLEAIPETLALEKNVKLENVKQEKGQSDDDDFDDRAAFEDDDDDDLDDQPLTRLASKVPKKESVDLLDLLDNAKVAEKRKSTTKTKATPAKKIKTKKESPKATASKTKPEKKKKDDLGWSLDAAKQNAQIILRHTTAYPFQQSSDLLRCCFCREDFNDPAMFRAHMDVIHMGVDRSTCNKSNLDSQTRVDVTNLRCLECIKKFASIEAVAKHLHDEHELEIQLSQSLGLVPLKLEKERFECVVCSKKFTSTMQVSRHTGTHYFRNICDICGKRFESRNGIDSHVKSRHSSGSFYCRQCKGSFTTMEAKKEHMRLNKDCLPFRCNLCKERFPFWERREDHLVEVHGKERKLYRCTECEKVFERRTLLYFHFKAAHTEDHKCTYCELTFSTRRDLREHTHLHTGERPLKCNVCDKTFVRDKALRQHLVIHDDSKKKICTVCSRLFTDRKKLRIHVEKHHPESYEQEFGLRRK